MNDAAKYNELIYLVIDGEASEIERTSFFDSLHANSELQHEFHTALRMTKAAESVPVMNSVPKELTGRLFEKAGLNYVSGEIPTFIPAVQKSNFFVPILGKISFIIAGLIVGAGLMYVFTEKSSVYNEPEKVISQNSNQMQLQEKSTLVPETKSLNQRKTPVVQSELIRQNNSALTKNSEPLVNDEIIIQPEEKRNFKIENSAILSENLKINVSKYTNNTTSLSENPDYNPIEIQKINMPDFHVEIRNSAYWNLPKENIYPSELSKFNNMSFAVLYDISDELALGAEIRQETFYVKYFSINEFNEKYIFEQQPNLTSYGALLRYKFINNDKLKIFAQNNLSVNNYGIIYRGGVGFEYILLPEMSLIGMVDFAGLYFRHQNNSNTAEKAGFSYGINFKF